jgi:enoyl-CoA hydratase
MECGKPVIAAVNGLGIGAGCVLAFCADIILVADDAYLSMTEVDVGLAGGVRHVRRHLGESNARLMIYTARRMTGPELLRMNAASLCLPRDQLLGAAQQIGREIAAKVPLAIQAAKKSFQVTEYMPLHEGYVFEQSQTVALARTEDTQEAWRAFAEKRKPVFKGR